jgi:ABC-2 type transport system ATP-binding protein
MGASRFVGRVGGLAVALGVGAAAFSGAGVAGADTSDPGSDSRGGPRASSANDSSAPVRGRKTTAAAPAGATVKSGTRQQRNSRPESASAAVPSVPSVPTVSGGKPTSAPDIDPAPVPAAATPAASRQAVPAVAATVSSTVPAVAETVEPAPVPAPEPAPAGEVSAFLSEADNGLADGAGTDPMLPVGSPLEWALLAFARRQPLSAASTASQVASVTASQEVSSQGLVVDPTVMFVDGIFQGALNATSARGAELTYTPVDGGCSGSGAPLCGFGDLGGKITMDTVPIPGGTDPQSYTILPYATWLNPGGVKGTEDFQVRVSEVTDFDNFLINIPLIGLVAAPVIDLLQRLPLISDLLAPIIGASVVATVSVDVATMAPGDTPLAFTYDVISFDDTPISTNFFPATGIAAGEMAPLVLNGPGLGSPGETDPYSPAGTFGTVPGVGLMRDEGYNVITWDPRGEFASGGVLQLDNPFFEGRDASALVSWAAGNPLVELDGADDPAVGMVGGSYGGGIQMVTASTDPRIDAIVPNGNWYSLTDALYPAEEFKTAWAALLLLDLVEAGARINNVIYQGVLTGSLFGFLTQTAQAVLASSGPTSLLNQLQAPTLLFQGTVDALFPLDQSVLNAQTIFDNPWNTPVKLAWFCGGHGSCSTGTPPAQQDLLFAATFDWLDQYVAGDGQGADAVPVFQWWDQDAVLHTSDLLPFEPGFLEPDPYSATGAGGTLGIIPILGGSGPGSGVAFPLNLIFPTEAGNAINVALTPTVGDQIVGAPQVSFTYRGLGTGGAVYAQLVDDATGLVVGNNVTAIPVRLDGRERTVSMSLNDIAYTVGAGDSLTLQITAWSSIFANAAIGVVDISDIEVDLPVRAV